MKRNLSAAKSISPEDLMKSCGVLASEVGLTDEQRVSFSEDDEQSAGWLAGWTTQLNRELDIEVDAILRDDDESGAYAHGHIGHPLRAVWSVTVWPKADGDDDEVNLAVTEMHDLPFSEALRLASAIIQTHKFKKE